MELISERLENLHFTIQTTGLPAGIAKIFLQIEELIKELEYEVSEQKRNQSDE